MEHPRLEKITLSMGVGEAKQNSKALDEAVEQLAIIAGQRPAITRARKSIAQFKLREGMAIGCKVTLRGNRMWEFLDRLTSVALPRIRDFRGINPDGFDGRGNYNLGLREQTIFPEIDYDRVDPVRGLNVTITTTAETDEEGRALLRHLGMPFRAEGYSAEELAARRRASRAQVRPRSRPDAGRRRRGEDQPAGEGLPHPEVQDAEVHALPFLRPPRAVFRKFGLCRVCLRESAHAGVIPGMTKSSW